MYDAFQIVHVGRWFNVLFEKDFDTWDDAERYAHSADVLPGEMGCALYGLELTEDGDIYTRDQLDFFKA